MDKFFFDSEENIASFMESFPSIVLILDADDGDILGCNEAAVSFYGYAREELLSRSIFDFNCLFKEEVLNRIKKAKQKNQSFFRFRHRISSGDLKDVEVYSVPITFKGKSRMFSMIRDISETVVASRQLEEKTKQLNCFHRLFRIFEEVCDDFDLLCRQVESAVRCHALQ